MVSVKVLRSDQIPCKKSSTIFLFSFCLALLFLRKKKFRLTEMLQNMYI